MAKKVISFFLASSILDVQFDRMAIGDFINELNNIYYKYDIFIRLYKCESDTMDQSIHIGGSQKNLDELIRTSDLCFVIFNNKVGAVTYHELNVALDEYREHEKPKIVVYFKKENDNSKAPEEIQEIMNIIDNELLHYHREYSHIDALKLGIMTQLQVNGLINVDFDPIGYDSALLSTKNIPLFANNSQYLELIEKQKELNKKCSDLRKQFSEDNSNVKLLRELGSAEVERNKINEDIDFLVKRVLNIGNKLVEYSIDGSVITEKLRDAINLFDKGDFDGVLDLLDPNDIESRVEEIYKQEKAIKEAKLVIIWEYKLRILALKTKNCWKEVNDTYLKIVELVDRDDMRKDVLIEFADFLLFQRKYKECISICQKLLSLKEYLGYTIEQKLTINNYLGSAYYYSTQIIEAEKVFDAILKISVYDEYLSDKSKELMADISRSLAKICYNKNDYEKAEKYYNQAIDYYNDISSKESKKLETKISIALKDLSGLYFQMNKHKDAIDLLRETAKTLSDIEGTEIEYAKTCEKLAYELTSVIRHRKNERTFITSIQIKNKIEEKGSKYYGRLFEKICKMLLDVTASNNLLEYGSVVRKLLDKSNNSIFDKNTNNRKVIDLEFYQESIDMSEIDDLCKKVLSIRRDKAYKNPESFSNDLAKACNNYAIFYATGEKFKESENYFKEAIEIQQRLCKMDNDSVDTFLAETYSHYAFMLRCAGRFKDSVDYYNSAIDIFKKHNNAEKTFDNDLARTYASLGETYLSNNDIDSALKNLFTALELYSGLYLLSPESYLDRIINAFSNIVYALDQKEYDAYIAKIVDVE